MNLENIIKNIPAVNGKVKDEASKRVDSLIKPLGSLGRLEDLAIQLSGITENIHNNFDKKCIIVMSSDNGIVDEGVACSPQHITAIQTINMLEGLTGISVFARQAGSDLKVVDIGVKAKISHPNLISKKIRMGTSNMAIGPAMSREEAIRSIEIGIEVANQAIAEEGYKIIGTGEMGIGNTSTSSAVTMSLLGIGDEAIGRGAGLTDEGFESKKNAIQKALEINAPNPNDPIDVLSKVGGFDIGGLAGCFLASAYNRVPILIDGVISATAALLASRLCPHARDYMIPSHISLEPAYRSIMKSLDLKPYLHMDMRLGEGSGCPMGFQIIDMACSMVNHMATFDEIKLDDDFLVDIRD